MRSLIVLATVLFSNLALADIQAQWTSKTAKIYYHSFNAYYSCDYAEAQTKAALKAMGARDVQVRCTGGLPDFESVHVTAKFSSASYANPAVSAPVETAKWTATAIQGRDACEFNDTVVKSLLPHFTHGKVAHSNSCWGAQGRYSFRLQVLK